MNNLPQVFSYEGQAVRTTVINGEPWFVASDVCSILEIANATDTMKRLDDDERTLVSIEGASNGLPVNAVNEPGLYTLILGSRKPEAKTFKRWITHEVIPAIRKTGTYSKPMSVEDLIIMQAQSMKELRTKVDQVQNQLEVANHRIDSLDTTDVIGDLRQRLNGMVRKYARRKGVPYNVAWADFTQAFNTAFHTNLELRKTNYQEKHRRQVTTPEFLEIDGKLEDAVRVADKLINRAG